MLKMNTKTFIERCHEELQCRYCGETVKGQFSYYGGGITSEDVLAKHEEKCPSNPDSPEGILRRDIVRCQNEARIFNCLNCRHYQQRCKGTKL